MNSSCKGFIASSNIRILLKVSNVVLHICKTIFTQDQSYFSSVTKFLLFKIVYTPPGKYHSDVFGLFPIPISVYLISI